MPNWCFSNYSFKFNDETKAEKFEEFLKKATDSSNPVNLKGQGFGSNWLGNVLIACGYPVSYKTETDSAWDEQVIIGNEKYHAPAYNYRGEITDFERDDDTVTISLETAWEPMPGPLATALYAIGLDFSDGEFDGVSVRWTSEEPGCEYFGGSDSEYCDGDIRAYAEIPMGLYDNDSKLREIFDSEETDDDGEMYFVNQYDYSDKLLKDINGYLGTTCLTLNEATGKLKEKGINFSYVGFQFEDWLVGIDFNPETDALPRKEAV